jgi:hypothetical protein
MASGFNLRAGLVAVLLAAAAAWADPVFRVVSGSSGDTNLVRNPGFEQTLNGQFTIWQRAPQGWRIAPGEGRLGTQALACEAPNTLGWRGASQTLMLDRTNTAPLVVRGWSRAENVSGSADSDYSLYVDILYRDGTPLWGQTGNFRTGTHDWEQREFVILPEKPVRSLTIHCLFREHSGNAWFDDVSVAEIRTPASAVIFQGTPMVMVPSTNPPPNNPVTYATGDGLRLTLDGLRVAGLQVDNRELAGPTPSGFLAWDVAHNSDVYPFVDGACPELNLRLTATVTAFPNHLVLAGRVASTIPDDRAILLAFALPLDARGWNWHDDIRRARVIAPDGGEFHNVTSVGCGTTGTLSAYPLACVEDGQSGLALALDMAQPALYRLVYHAGTRQFFIVYDLALVRESARFPSAADFRFLLYRFEPRWGFRAAWQKLTEIFPDYFVVRSREQGLWMPFTDVSLVQDWEDFGFRYHEGNNNVPFDDQHGILSFRYTEPMTWWMPLAPELPRTEAAALTVRDALVNGPAGPAQQMASLSHGTAMYDAAGHPALLFRNEPWANGAVWSLNPNPLLPAQPNAATVYWNSAIRDRLYGAGANGRLDGEYLDSLEGYVTATLNFRRDHFASTTVPLTFATDTRQPALFKGLAVFEFTRWISADLHRIGKLCFANGVPYRFSFLCPWLDVLGTETNWLVDGQYQAAPHATMSLWRTLAGRKPYLLLMNTDFEAFGPAWVERYFQRSLFYGMYPSMFSANAAENPYWLNPTWYNRDRALFRRYLPLIRQVGEAGWQPITDATCDRASVLVERFGPTGDGTTFYTLFNDGTTQVSGHLRLTAESLENQARAIGTDLLNGNRLPWTESGWPITLGPQSAGAIRLQPPPRFQTVTVEAGRVRLTVEAPLESAQILEASANLRDWRPRSTNVIRALPSVLVDDVAAGGEPRFYRLRWP